MPAGRRRDRRNERILETSGAKIVALVVCYFVAAAVLVPAFGTDWWVFVVSVFLLPAVWRVLLR
jgi:hypothetical protein